MERDIEFVCSYAAYALMCLLDYIFNYKISLTTNQMGFDTIEINLVWISKEPAHLK